MRRLRDFSLCLCLLLLWPLVVQADDSWRQTQTEARGQTVWFNARVETRPSTAIWRGSARRSNATTRSTCVLSLSPMPPTR